MKPLLSIFLILLANVGLILVPADIYARSDSVREPVWAGRFYPSRANELRKVIDDFAELAEGTRVALPQDKILRALILPHAGYIYSGWTAAHAARVLHHGAYKKVIVMAPDHRIGFANAVISDVDAYRTPLGTVRIHADADTLRQQNDFFKSSRISDAREHAVEVLLPFLQRFLNTFQLIPIVLGPCPTDKMVGAITPLLTDSTLLVVSSDLSHYLPYAQATAQDHRTIEMILDLDAEKLSRQENAACGKEPITILIQIAKQCHWMPVLLHYSNSGDTAGDRDRVVGYAAIAFYGDPCSTSLKRSPDHLSQEQGLSLVKLARMTIEEKLLNKSDAASTVLIDRLKINNELQQPCGTFVTLKRNRQLRGCIGNPTANGSILDSVQRNALHAAFHDPRFPPLTSVELDGLDIEVSILSIPEPLAYENAGDLLSKLRVHVDGVIIRQESAAALFLPQVWQQLPEPGLFLSRLCLKAGLPADAWQRTRLDVLTFQVQHFHEEN